MKTLIFLQFALGFTLFGYSQTVKLPETVISINANYLNMIDLENSCKYVKKLEETLLNYDHSELTDLYDSIHDIYKVTFKITGGTIVASFNKEGKILKTYEKYNNIKLPQLVMQAISEKYPNCSILEDVYVVKYHCDEDALKQEYRVKIKSKNMVIMVKTDTMGAFI